MNDIKDDLLEKAEYLIELRDYKVEEIHQDEDFVDIKISEPSSDEKILLRVVFKSKLKHNVAGVETVRGIEQNIQEQNINKAIIFGKRFTREASKKLRENNIESFSIMRDIVPLINIQDLYKTIRKLVDSICIIKCGSIPRTESECKGFSKEPIKCSFCGGNQEPNSSLKQKCPICGDTGVVKDHYSCDVRILSDNADFHFERGWIRLLQNDLMSLLKALRTIRIESNQYSSLQSLLDSTSS